MLRLLSGLLTAGLCLAWSSTTHADDTAKAIIEKAIKAHGGADNLAKLKIREEKANFTLDSGGKTFPFTSDSLIHLPHQEKTTTRRQVATFIHVINGDKAWANIGGKTREATAEQLRVLQARLHADYVVTLSPILKDKGFALSPMGEGKVNDRPVLGVKVTAKDHEDVDLYFDKESGLLVKSEVIRKVDGQDIVMATVYSEYKETEGLRWPRKKVDYRDGKQERETEITELKFLDKIDAREFDKP
jgi:hypothetical protein